MQVKGGTKSGSPLLADVDLQQHIAACDVSTSWWTVAALARSYDLEHACFIRQNENDRLPRRMLFSLKEVCTEEERQTQEVMG
jgi:hypothetical protein